MNISEIIGSVAPTLGAAIGGPAGGAVGLLISKILGVDANDEQAVIAAVKDQEAIIKLKELDLQFAQLKLEESKSKDELSEKAMTMMYSVKYIVIMLISIFTVYAIIYFSVTVCAMFAYGNNSVEIYRSIDYNFNLYLNMFLGTLCAAGGAYANNKVHGLIEKNKFFKK